MHRMDADVIARRVGRIRESLPYREVGIVPQSNPVEDAQHDRLALAEQHDAERPQRIIDGTSRLNPAAAERMANGWRHIDG